MSSTENVKVNLLLHHWDQLEHSELAWLNQTERCSHHCSTTELEVAWHNAYIIMISHVSLHNFVTPK